MFFGKGWGILGLLVQLLLIGSFLYWCGDGLHRFAVAPPGQKPSLADPLVALALAVATAYAMYRRFKGAQEDLRFKNWLIANAERIQRNDPVFFRKQRIHLDTELVRHHLVLSAIVISFRSQTRWIIKGREPRFGHALSASLYTLFYGWWGFPFGIYWTLVALVKNISGSTTVKVRDLLQPAPAKPAGFSQRLQAGYGKRLRGGFFIDEKPVGILPAQAVVATQR